MTNKKGKNPVCAILWNDAAYAFTKMPPKNPPLPQLTTGFVISTNKRFINIATNVSYDAKTKKLIPIDGFIIPLKVENEFRKIDYFDAS